MIYHKFMVPPTTRTVPRRWPAPSSPKVHSARPEPISFASASPTADNHSLALCFFCLPDSSPYLPPGPLLGGDNSSNPNRCRSSAHSKPAAAS